jgi:hypothetical protein
MPHVSIARGHVQVTFRDGSKFLTAVPKAHQPVTLRIDTGAYYPMASCPIEREEKIEQHQWVINRKAANNVRAKYGRFYRYVKGMVALRREQITDSYTDTEMLCVPRSENENALGQSIAGLAWSNRLDNKYPDNDPRMPRFESGTWRERMDKFLLLISDHEDESVQTDNFATAFAAVLALCSARKYWMRNRSDGSVLIEASQIPKKVDELIFKYHTEVFEKVPVPEGRIPSTKYDTWV